MKDYSAPIESSDKIPDIARKAVGSCKFIKTSSYSRFLMLEGLRSSYNLDQYDYQFKPDDTCVQIIGYGLKKYFIPASALFCDSNGFASFKTNFEGGKCTVFGNTVEISRLP